MKTVLAAALLLCGAAAALAAAPAPVPQGDVLPGLLGASVTVASGGDVGSGVVFRNGPHCFVWTAGHVVAGTQKVEVLVDPPTGRPVAMARYADVSVLQVRFAGGRKVGHDVRYARVLRYSDATQGGDDLALLRVYDGSFGGGGVNFADAVPAAGTALWHVGSMAGARGMNSVSDGVFSTAGRLASRGEHNETADPKVFDQVTVASLKGCSGGGVFLKSDGLCIGLLAGGMDNSTECGSLVVPARRIRSFARVAKCEWAVSKGVAVPAGGFGPVTDRPFPMPAKVPP